MAIVLVVVGSGCLLAALLVGLDRAGLRRAIAPVAAALVGVGLLVGGILAWPAHGARPVAVTHGPGRNPSAQTPATATEPATPPAGSSSADDPGCSFTPGTTSPGRQPPKTGLPESGPGDAQHLPSEFTPGPPAGPFVRGAYSYNNPGFDAWTEATIAPALTDLNTADYADLSLPETGGMQLAIGTPKPGTCWNELSTTAMTSYFAGGHVSNPRSEHPGPRMSTYHLRLVCAEGGIAFDMCAWAGPGIDGRHPLFGILSVPYMSPYARSEARIVAFTEAVFEALTPSAR